MTSNIEARVTIAARPEAVFAAITDGPGAERWLGDGAEAARAHSLLDAEHGIEFPWELRDRETVVVIRLEPTGSATTVVVEHDGIAERAEGEASVTDFWVLALENLRGLVERDETAASPRFEDTRGDVRLELEAGAPAERVFSALTDPVELDRWIGEGAEVDLRVGGRYDLGWDHGPVKILDLQPGRRLAYSWRYPDARERTVADETAVAWTLEESGGRTRIVLVHSGFAAEAPTGDYHLGWLAFLGLLKNLVESGPRWDATKADSRVATG